jgi:hypothetical protein
MACGGAGTPAYCCSAVSRSLIAKPPPFLGVSSLNLAALRSGHFFCLGLLVSGFVAPSLVDPQVHVARRSCPETKIPKAIRNRLWASRPTSLPAPAQIAKSLAQKLGVSPRRSALLAERPKSLAKNRACLWTSSPHRSSRLATPKISGAKRFRVPAQRPKPLGQTAFYQSAAAVRVPVSAAIWG